MGDRPSVRKVRAWQNGIGSNYGGMSSPARSVYRRVVKLAEPHYLFAPLPPQKRGHGHKI